MDVHNYDKKRKPDFIGIGIAKSGTTWLYDNLNKMDQVWLPPIKELHFFDEKDSGIKTDILSRFFDNHWLNKLWRYRLKAYIYNCYKSKSVPHLLWHMRFFFLPRTKRNYSALFNKDSKKIAGEITPDYAVIQKQRINEIYDVNKNCKIILLIRNPIERAWSHLKMVKLKHSMFSKPANSIVEISDKEILSYLDDIKNMGIYSKIIENWESVFGKQNVYVGIFDELVKDPGVFFSNICSFIGLTIVNSCSESFDKPSNKGIDIKIPEKYSQYLHNQYKGEIESLISLFPDKKEYFVKWNQLK